MKPFNTTRLHQLNQRYDALLEANIKHSYVRTKPDKYFAVLLELKRLRTAEMRKADAMLDKSKYKVTLTLNDLDALCNPRYN